MQLSESFPHRDMGSSLLRLLHPEECSSSSLWLSEPRAFADLDVSKPQGSQFCIKNMQQFKNMQSISFKLSPDDTRSPGRQISFPVNYKLALCHQFIQRLCQKSSSPQSQLLSYSYKFWNTCLPVITPGMYPTETAPLQEGEASYLSWLPGQLSPVITKQKLY